MNTMLYQAVSREESRQAIYGPLPVGIVIWDASGHLAYANPAAEGLLGASCDRLRGLDPTALFRYGPGGDGPRGEAQIDPADIPPDGHCSLLRPDGECRRVQVGTVAVPDPGGKGHWGLTCLTDQSAASRLEDDLGVERGLLHALMDSMPDHIYFKDRDSRFTRTNRAHAAYFGLSDPAQAIGRTDFDFYGEEARVFFAEEQRLMVTGQPLVGAIEDQSGLAQRPHWVQTTKVPIVRDGRVSGLVGISRDVTELQLAQAQLAHQAMHDGLTGLPNRALLLDRLEQALRAAQREHTPFALCLLDLDRFKEVNDTLGHRCGDLLLREVAARARHTLRDADTVARLGGDEFAILLPGANTEAATATAARICRALQGPLDLEGHCADVAGSIGIAVFPFHGDDATALLAHADVAMYAAKQTGVGYAVYDVTIDERSPDYLALPQEFRQAGRPHR